MQSPSSLKHLYAAQSVRGDRPFGLHPEILSCSCGWSTVHWGWHFQWAVWVIPWRENTRQKY